MEHAAYSVDVLDANGRIVGKKLRRDIDKLLNIYHSVHTLLITPRGELVLGSIPAREDLPNIYPRRLGTTIATIRRSGESARQAAVRSLARELFIENGDVQLLGEQMFQLPTHKNYLTAYYLIAEPPISYSLVDIETLVVTTPQQFRTILADKADKLAPTLQAVWKAWSHKLPI